MFPYVLFLSYDYWSCLFPSCLASPGAGTNQDINKYLLKLKKGKNYFPPIVLKCSQQAWESPGGLVKPVCWAPLSKILMGVSASVFWCDAPEFALLTRCCCWSGTHMKNFGFIHLKAVCKVGMVIFRGGWQKFLEALYISGNSPFHSFLNMNVS